jgi:hypothetical protein
MTKAQMPFSSYGNAEKVNFRVGSTGVRMGAPVKLNQTSGRLDLQGATTVGDFAIGKVNYDHDYVALEGTTTIAAGDQAQVVMFGQTFNEVAGGTFNAGVFVKYDSVGYVVQDSVTTKSDSTVGIALQASTVAGQIVKVLHKLG